MLDVNSISMALQGLSAIQQLITAAIAGITDTKAKEKILGVQSKLSDVQQKLFDIQGELFRLQSENQELRRTLSDIENWDKRISEYEMVKTDGGAVVLKSHSEPVHYICPACKENKLIGVLQVERSISGTYICSVCHTRYPVDKQKEVKPVRITRC